MTRRILQAFASLSLLLTTVWGNLGSPQPSESGILWYTDYTKAKQTAERQDLPMFLLFTGSDWCGWCMKLDSEVLSSKEFAEEAARKFVFVKLDFPNSIRQTTELKAQNEALKKRFAVRGFPTVILQNADESRIAITGYRPGGGKEYARHLSDEVSHFQAVADSFQDVSNEKELQAAYEAARRNGREEQQQQILAAGLKLKKNGFFLLERYQQLLESGRRSSPEATEIHTKLQALTGPENSELRYRLAVIDFQALDDQQLDATAAAAPLVDYLKAEGTADRDHAWRVQMMVAQVFRSHGDVDKALEYTQAARDSAPETFTRDIDQAIHDLKSELEQTR